MAHVPAAEFSPDAKDSQGRPIVGTYGGYDVELIDCSQCGRMHADTENARKAHYEQYHGK